MSETRDVEGPSADEVVADFERAPTFDMSAYYAQVLIADWRAKKEEIERLTGLVEFYRTSYPTEAQLAQQCPPDR